MLAAATRAEYPALDPFGEGVGHRGRPATWQDVLAARDAALRAHPKVQAHFALKKLLSLLVEVGRGRQTGAQVLATAQREAAADQDNLLARLAHAVLADLISNPPATQPATQPNPAEPDVLGRFEALRRIVETPGSTDRATLYNADFTIAWHDVLKRYIKCPDVAASLAAATPHYLITNHYAALPIIQHRLADLAAKLREAGHQQAADRCVQWIARCALGLMQSEENSGTLLLCADLLIRSVDAGSPAAAALRRFRDDFHSAVGASPIDICDQSFSPVPAIRPSMYRRAFYSLAAAGAIGLLSLGGAAMSLAACLAALIGRIGFRRSAPQSSDRRRTTYASLAVAAAVAVFISILIAYRLDRHGIYSQAWVFVVVLSVLATGAVMAVVLASFACDTASRVARYRVAATIVLASLPILPVCASPASVTWISRALDLAVGTVWVLGPGLLMVVIAALAASPARWKTIAASAAFLWFVNAVLALAVLQYHRAADRRYQQGVAAGRLDEVPARLGADWPERYLQPALEVYCRPAS
jgi:hypothetical protein